MYRPDMGTQFSPRVTEEFRAAVSEVCEREEMPEADVLRYSFEAATFLARAGRLPLRPMEGELDSMVTVRTSGAVEKMVREIHALVKRNDAEASHADVLRRLLFNVAKIARKRGMPEVLAIRRKLLPQ